MRPTQNNRRNRGRNNRKSNNTPSRNQVFDSNGPDVRVRGNALQIFEKYQTLARDAAGNGNRVKAEACYQHAEHYLRLYNVAVAAQEKEQFERQRRTHEHMNERRNRDDERRDYANRSEYPAFDPQKSQKASVEVTTLHIPEPDETHEGNEQPSLERAIFDLSEAPQPDLETTPLPPPDKTSHRSEQEAPPRKRGRPRKNPDTAPQKTLLNENKPKRPVGRPRKIIPEDANQIT